MNDARRRMREAHGFNSWIELSESAYASNLAFFRRLVGPGVELSAVVKANAYGHGMIEIAGLAIRHGADSFCVHSLDEAQRLRRAGFTQDVLILGHVPLARLDEAVDGEFRIALLHHQEAERLAEMAEARERRTRVHLKVETGTYRQGVDASELEGLLDFLERHPRLELDGVYTHFANIEDTTDHGYARTQLERFGAVIEQVARRQGDVAGNLPQRHAACSAAALLFPGTHFDMVRLGVSQYGLWPSKETLVSYRMTHDGADPRPLVPVLTWKTRVGQLKRVPAAAYVGYGCSYQTTRETLLAVLPIGYSDGYARRLSNQAHVLIRGRRAPVRGRVCMNLLLVDVTDIPEVALEDEVVLLGRQKKPGGDGQEITAAQLAELAGTLHYELVARLNPDLPRLVVT